ncbi:MAG: bacillithiol biosynthesis cysteine-adding enzyme BshC [Flavobacteriales bacterium]|jgi:bacillithiol biosynthesis cysteine-adding enzyme BshC
MQSSKLPLLISGVSPLIHSYLSGDPILDVFHNGLPSHKNIKRLSTDRDFPDEVRKVLADILRLQYSGFTVSQKVEDNLHALTLPTSRTITTGHQLCLSMGPFYMISKVCSAIALASRMNDFDDSKVYIPVFWMATEDHDFEEINHLFLFNKKVEWARNDTGAVGRMSTKGIAQAVNEMAGILGADFAESDIGKLISESYEEINLARATRRLFNSLFGDYGLLIIDGDSRALKTLFEPTVKRELDKGFSETAINYSSAMLKKSGFKTQINAREINLFFLLDGYRDRIVRNGADFATADGQHAWTEAEIMKLVEDAPENFSPNVALRPVFQETILPNVAYIGGAGEIAYWLQLKGVFDAEELPFPALVVRESSLIINKGTSKKIASLGLNVEQLFHPTQKVIKSLLSAELPDWTGLEDGIQSAWSKVEFALESVDPTLAKSASSEKAKSAGTLKALQAKALRASKEKNEAQVRKVEAVRNWVYPEGVLQERYANILQFGPEMVRPTIQFLIDEFEPGEANIHVVSFD